MNSPKPIDDRRLFFRYLARETVVWCENLCGKPNVKLSDLPKLPPGELAALIPQVRPGVRIAPGNGRVSALPPGAKEKLDLFPCEEPELSIFNGFNGTNTIRQVAEALSAATGWPYDRSLVHVKDLFFRLVLAGVCLPANPTPL